MPDGGTLRIACEPARGRRVSIVVADTGSGSSRSTSIGFSTCISRRSRRAAGSASRWCYRTIQMHDGEIEVESTPGKGHDIPNSAAAGVMSRTATAELRSSWRRDRIGCDVRHVGVGVLRCPGPDGRRPQPLDVPVPPPRVVEVSEPEVPPPVSLPEEPARKTPSAVLTPPPRGNEGRGPLSRRGPNPSSKPSKRAGGRLKTPSHHPADHSSPAGWRARATIRARSSFRPPVASAASTIGR